MASPTKIHPATLVTNIKTSIPIQLNEDGSNFHTWVTLFKLYCRAHLVDSYIIPDDSTSGKKRICCLSFDAVFVYTQQ